MRRSGSRRSVKTCGWVVQGRKYLVKKLDMDKKIAYVRLTKLGYYTSTRDYNEVQVKGGIAAYPQRRAVEDTPQRRRTMACCNEAEVTRRFLGYTKISQVRNEWLCDTVAESELSLAKAGVSAANRATV